MLILQYGRKFFLADKLGQMFPAAEVLAVEKNITADELAARIGDNTPEAIVYNLSSRSDKSAEEFRRFLQLLAETGLDQKMKGKKVFLPFTKERRFYDGVVGWATASDVAGFKTMTL